MGHPLPRTVTPERKAGPQLPPAVRVSARRARGVGLAPRPRRENHDERSSVDAAPRRPLRPGAAMGSPPFEPAAPGSRSGVGRASTAPRPRPRSDL